MELSRDDFHTLERRAWHSHDADTWYELSTRYARLGWEAEAKAGYRRVLQLRPDHEASLAALVELLLVQGLSYSAMQVLREAAAAKVAESFCRPRLQQLEARCLVERVSFFAPAFRCDATLERCLRSIQAQTYPLHEIFVVDDGSPDRSAEIARRLGVRVIAHAENRGLAAACNTALEHCTGDFLAKIDSDVELSPTWLERAMLAFTSPTVAGVGGKLVEHYALTLADQWRRKFMAQHWGPQKLDTPPGLFGADCVYRVSALRVVNGWDLRYRTNFEDMNLSVRLRAAGYQLVYEPLAWGRHLRRDTLHEVLRNFWGWYHPPVQDQGAYDSLAAAAKLVPRNRGLVHERLGYCLRDRSFALLYPTFVLYYCLCLADVQHLRRRGTAAPEVVSQTALGVFVLTLRQVRLSLVVPAPVAERTLADLKQTAREILEAPEQTKLDDDTACEALACLGSAQSEDVLNALLARLPAADAGYLQTFERENFLQPFDQTHGALMGHSIEAIQEDEREARRASPDQARFVLFNPPLRDENAGAAELAVARWRRPARLQALVERMRAQGQRVFLLDAAAEQLDDLEAHEQLLGAEPAAVIYVAEPGGLERVASSVRRLKLLVPKPPRLVLAWAKDVLAPGEESSYPMFDAIYPEAPATLGNS